MSFCGTSFNQEATCTSLVQEASGNVTPPSRNRQLLSCIPLSCEAAESSAGDDTKGYYGKISSMLGTLKYKAHKMQKITEEDKKDTLLMHLTGHA